MYNTNIPTRAELPSTRKLLRSTALAILVACGLLTTTILPAEYGVDPTGIGRTLGLTQMGEIKQTLAAEAANEAVSPATEPQPAPTTLTVGTQQKQVPTGNADPREDTMTVKLQPNEAAEIKLVMRKDNRVDYEWTTAGGSVNYDTHGDPYQAPKGFYHGYGKGRNETIDQGALQAAFDGKHGWFWRNRSNAEITITLKTRGDYEKIERVL